jgi:dTDP-4-amino-4,6-dideoxygalactose transaminase
MVLTNDKKFVDWARIAIRDGKQEGIPFHKQEFTMLGWNAYMTPEQAARGLQLFHCNKIYDDLLEIPDYPDLSKSRIYSE